ncbi:MAG: nucleotidyltransferase family protein [Acidimicrobiales bacterium]|jgi:hypothetical protein
MRFTLFSDFSDEEAVPSEVAWRSECPMIVSHGLAPVAHRLIHDRSIPVPEAVVKEFSDARFFDSAFTMTVVSRSRAGIDALRAAEIPFVVTKGPGIAKVCATVSDRPFADLDVVVGHDKFRSARDVLRHSGYAEQSRTIQPWDSFNWICREATNLRTPDGGSIDLHHRVSPWYWSSGLGLDHLVSGVEETAFFGVQLPLVSTVDNLLVAALHVVSDRSRPGQTFRVWRDLLILLNSCSIDDVVAAATRAGLADWLAWILGCLPDRVRPDEVVEALRDAPGDLTGGFRLRMLLPPGLASQNLLGHVFRLPWPNACWFVAGMVVPSPSYLELRYPTAHGRYVRWWLDSLRNVGPAERAGPAID